MKVILVFVLFGISSTLTEKYPCHFHLSVDLTDGIRTEENKIIHNNVTYPEDQYFQINDTIYGCLCNIETCVRKCCPLGYGKRNKDCVKSNDTLATKFLVPVYDEMKLADRNYEFKYIFGGDCPEEEHILEPENFSKERSYLQRNGSLYMRFHNTQVGDFRPQQDFCVDFDPSVESRQIISLLCFPPHPLKAFDIYICGMLISVPFLLVTLLVYACIPDLQNFHGKSLMCSVVCFLIVYLFIVALHIDDRNRLFCLIAPFVIYIGFVGSFMWLHVMCIDIWWTFSGRKGYKGSEKKSEHGRFFMYSLYAWGVPLVILFITIVLQFAPNLPDWVIRPEFGVVRCWFPDDRTLGYYFYAPLWTIIIVNLLLFAHTSFIIWNVRRNIDKSMKNESQRHGTDSDKQRYKLFIKLVFMFGINWLMEVIAWCAETSNAPKWLWYVTDMCNCLYGVLIFLIFVCNANVWKLIRKRYDDVFRPNETQQQDKKQQQMESKL